MKSKTLLSLLSLISFSSLAIGQVGINTPDPQSSLDVVGNGATTSAKDGIIAPRISKQQLASKVSGTYAAAQTGATVYVNDVTAPTGTTPSLAQVSQVSSTGYYYFDGSLWVAYGSTIPSVNIYNSNGSLTGNRTVAQAANSLAFTGTATNGFSVDGSTFSVDAANDRVGIGTIAPNNRLDLGSSVGSSITDVIGKKLAVYNNAGGTSFYGFGISSGILQFHAASAATDVPGAVLTNTGNFGVGVTAPTARIHVVSPTAGALRLVDGTESAGRLLTSDANGVGTWQTAPASVNIYNTNGSLTGNRVVTQAANTLAFTSTATNGFSVDGTTFSVDAANDRVGIGVAAPTARMHIVSPTSGALRLVDGTQSAGHVLTSDANGVGTWQILPASTNIYNTNGSLTGNRIVTQAANTLAFTSTATNGFSVDGTTFSVDAANNTIGIGTAAPVSKLDIIGDTFGVRRSQGVGSWDNLWIDLSNSSAPAINASGAEIGLQFKVGLNLTGTYGDGQTLTTVATMTSNGNVGIGTAAPTQRLHVIGNILASGTITPSDIRIKKDITDNSYGLKEIMGLRTINYRYKDEKLSKDKKIGFIAQEIKATMPELVSTADDEIKTLGVNYAEMSVVLTKALQQQQDMISELTKRVNQQEKQIETLNSIISKNQPAKLK